MAGRSRQSIGFVRGLVGIAILLFLFVTPPGWHLFLAVTNWFARLWTHQIMKSIHITPTPSAR